MCALVSASFLLCIFSDAPLSPESSVNLLVILLVLLPNQTQCSSDNILLIQFGLSKMSRESRIIASLDNLQCKVSLQIQHLTAIAVLTPISTGHVSCVYMYSIDSD